ncbi:competence type IV pilus assembly protein ComGB [Lacticigenium naphthae]|uniref:competence type IV pilus assembly protein ComGB n=1 Tax=Lacticigenium naphthae TaxID=515351 RepID=UPI000488E4A0|nr:competence type IV pilus assembly protein ComGB [Lacticigenium naphthae]
MDIFQKTRTQNMQSHKRISQKEQGQFLITVGSLIKEGFSLKESMSIVQSVSEKRNNWMDYLCEGLEKGERFDSLLKELGFSNGIIIQISFSFLHGNFHETLLSCGNQIKEYERNAKQIKELLRYPSFLLVLLFLIFLSLKTMMLPNLEMIIDIRSMNTTLLVSLIFFLIDYTIPLFITGSLSGIVIFYLSKKQFVKLTAIEKVKLLSVLPGISKLTKLHYTALFEKEWSGLLKNGFTFFEMVQIMQADHSIALFKEVGAQMEQELLRGKSLLQTFDTVPFFVKDFSNVIQRGEVTGQLALTMELHAKKCVEELNERIMKLIGLLQPILLIIIGAIIITIYLIILMPMFTFVNQI